MATHKSSKKRILISRKENARNRTIRSHMNTAIKRVVTAKDRATAQNELKSAYSVIDKTLSAGVIHRNKAANQKSRLSRFVAKMPA